MFSRCVVDFFLHFFINTTLLQPFTEVTLQMSQSNIPTLPFVLPLYHKMEQHLVSISTSNDKSWKVQHASEVGLKKLRKYSVPAMAHHTYVIGTSKSCPILLSLSDFYVLVLHPCLRSHWFAATADLDVQEEAIDNAEVTFQYIAETYLERKTPHAIVPASKPVAPPAIRTMSFLASACSFQWLTTALQLQSMGRTCQWIRLLF